MSKKRYGTSDHIPESRPHVLEVFTSLDEGPLF
jgi:hypothetical protein